MSSIVVKCSGSLRLTGVQNNGRSSESRKSGNLVLIKCDQSTRYKCDVICTAGQKEKTVFSVKLERKQIKKCDLYKESSIKILCSNGVTIHLRECSNTSGLCQIAKLCNQAVNGDLDKQASAEMIPINSSTDGSNMSNGKASNVRCSLTHSFNGSSTYEAVDDEEDFELENNRSSEREMKSHSEKSGNIYDSFSHDTTNTSKRFLKSAFEKSAQLPSFYSKPKTDPQHRSSGFGYGHLHSVSHTKPPTQRNRASPETPEHNNSHNALQQKPHYSWQSKATSPFANSKVQLQGFSNLGNTCYMNAILQALFGLDTMIFDLHRLSRDPRMKRSKSSCELSWSLIMLLMTKRKQGVLVEEQRRLLTKVKSAISSSAKRFLGYGQHDAHEFLGQVLDQVKEEILRVNKPRSASPAKSPYPSTSTNPVPTASPSPHNIASSMPLLPASSIPSPIASTCTSSTPLRVSGPSTPTPGSSTNKESSHTGHSTAGTTTHEPETDVVYSNEVGKEPIPNPISRNFEFEVRHTIYCLKCSEHVTKEETFHDLSLDIPVRKNSTESCAMQDAVDCFFRREELEYKCDHCGEKRAEVAHTFTKLPRVLVLHLKRYLFDQSILSSSKMKKSIKIPRYLSLEPHCNEDTRPALLPEENMYWYKSSESKANSVGFRRKLDFKHGLESPSDTVDPIELDDSSNSKASPPMAKRFKQEDDTYEGRNFASDTRFYTSNKKRSNLPSAKFGSLLSERSSTTSTKYSNDSESYDTEKRKQEQKGSLRPVKLGAGGELSSDEDSDDLPDLCIEVEKKPCNRTANTAVSTEQNTSRRCNTFEMDNERIEKGVAALTKTVTPTRAKLSLNSTVKAKAAAAKPVFGRDKFCGDSTSRKSEVGQCNGDTPKRVLASCTNQVKPSTAEKAKPVVRKLTSNSNTLRNFGNFSIVGQVDGTYEVKVPAVQAEGVDISDNEKEKGKFGEEDVWSSESSDDMLVQLDGPVEVPTHNRPSKPYVSLTSKLNNLKAKETALHVEETKQHPYLLETPGVMEGIEEATEIEEKEISSRRGSHGYDDDKENEQPSVMAPSGMVADGEWQSLAAVTPGASNAATPEGSGVGSAKVTTDDMDQHVANDSLSLYCDEKQHEWDSEYPLQENSKRECTPIRMDDNYDGKSTEEDDIQKALKASLEDEVIQINDVTEQENEDIERAKELSLKELYQDAEYKLPVAENIEHYIVDRTEDEDKKIAHNAEHGTQPFSYRLVSVVSHLGSSSSAGHYVSDVFDIYKDAWYTYDDDRASITSEDSVRSNRMSNGYIFFYVNKFVYDELQDLKKQKIDNIRQNAATGPQHAAKTALR